MGAISTVMKCGRKPVDINIIGLSDSGKTTILYKYILGLDKPCTAIHTIGFNMETITYKNLDLNVTDFGGGDKIQPMWRRHFKNRKALIYVLNSTEMDVREAKYVLDIWIESNEVQDVILLIFANKQDLPDAMTVPEIIYQLNLRKLKVKWHVQPSIAIKGDGIIDGLEWLYQQISGF